MTNIFETLHTYDKCRLECDGLTRVLSYVLLQNAVEHTVMVGQITDVASGDAFAPHFWISLPDGRIIDYRARMWLGDHTHVPHGIIAPSEYQVKYTGEPTHFAQLAQIVPILIQMDC